MARVAALPAALAGQRRAQQGGQGQLLLYGCSPAPARVATLRGNCNMNQTPNRAGAHASPSWGASARTWARMFWDLTPQAIASAADRECAVCIQASSRSTPTMTDLHPLVGLFFTRFSLCMRTALNPSIVWRSLAGLPGVGFDWPHRPTALLPQSPPTHALARAHPPVPSPPPPLRTLRFLTLPHPPAEIFSR